MNQITLGALTAVAPAGPPNQRALAKQRTREKILAAARRLFAERGYEGATIRDIAKAAGMSTGAVFASFADKADLFGEILEAEQAALREAMGAAAAGKHGQAAIVAMFDAAADLHMAELALFQAGMAAMWTPGLAAQLRRRLDRRPVAPLIAAAAREDVGCGEARIDALQTAGLLWEAYAAVLRRAGAEGLTLQAVKAQLPEKFATILAGARRS
jgi:AcrR family transcriptional regulator